MVYKLVEVDGLPVAKRSSHKESRGGAKTAVRTARSSGTIVEEVIYRSGTAAPDLDLPARPLQIPLVRGGKPVDHLPSLTESRDHLAAALVSLPWEGLGLSHGDPAIPTRFITPRGE
jgi:nicotinate phosphoribosyltransferase